jgi:hypothetical protein
MLLDPEGTYTADTIQSITPDGCVEFIFNFGSPYLLLTTTPPGGIPPHEAGRSDVPR